MTTLKKLEGIRLNDLLKRHLEVMSRFKPGEWGKWIRKHGEDQKIARETFQVIVLMKGVESITGHQYLIEPPKQHFPDFRVADLTTKYYFNVEQVRIPNQVAQDKNESKLAKWICKKKPPSLLGTNIMLSIYGDFTKRKLDLQKLSDEIKTEYAGCTQDIMFYSLTNPNPEEWVICRLNPEYFVRYFNPFD